MRRSSVVRTLTLAVSLLALPGGRAMADTACFSKHTSGGSSVPFKICISAHGNLVRLESAGEEEIRVGEIGEGYAVCSGAGPTLHGFDAGFDEAGFGPATITQPAANTFPLTIKRDTTDGIFRVVQTIDWRPEEREVSITMRIKNLSNTARNNVRLIRYFDGDMNGTAGNDDYQGTTYSAYAFEHGFPYSVLSLTGLTAGVPFVAGGSLPRAFWDPHDCNPSPFEDNPGDGVGWVTYNVGTIGAGQSTSVDLVYRAF